MYTLELYPFILETIRMAMPLVGRIAKYDRNLAGQLRRSLPSIALNTAEGMYRNDGNQRERFRTAMGSANESRTGFESAEVMRYLRNDDIVVVVDRLDRIARTLNKLARQ